MLSADARRAVRWSFWVWRVALGVVILSVLFFLASYDAVVQSRANEADVAEPHVPLAPVPATLNDFHLPGTQPNSLTEPTVTCTGCHVPDITSNYAGTMMANAARDPLFRAALQVANEDVNLGGEYCLRCHAPNGWLKGNSEPETDGSALDAEDIEGVTCNVCHRMVPPTPLAGESPRDAGERAHVTQNGAVTVKTGNSAYIVDRLDERRGPFNIGDIGAHKIEQTTFLRTSEFCGTCHDIDNPLLSFNAATGEFELNALNTPAPPDARLFPIERTYSEWLFSDFASEEGVTGLTGGFNGYPGLKRKTMTVDGPITVCQDCHMELVDNAPLVNGGTPRQVAKHHWAGGNAVWQAGIASFWDGIAGDPGFDNEATLANMENGLATLARAADMELRTVNNELYVTVINRTGHKLPTGYAEGRRMWLHVEAEIDGTVVYTAGVPTEDGKILNPVKVYEIKQGITDAHAQAIGRPEIAGEGFHFILNNMVVKDNRIPPRGWTLAEYESRDMQPVGAVYADGQYTDTTKIVLPPGSDFVSVRLLYQTASGEYLDFLELEANDPVSDKVVGAPVNWGQVVGTLRDLKLDNGNDLDDPVLMLFRGINIADLNFAKVVEPAGDLLPGQPVTYSIFFSNTSNVSFVNPPVELVDAVPALLVNSTIITDVDPTIVFVQTSDLPTLAWSLDDFDVDTAGVIHISGIISPLLTAATTITNSAYISATAGNDKVFRNADAVSNIVVPEIEFEATEYTIDESGGSVLLTVTLSIANPYAEARISVVTSDESAQAGQDYTAVNNTVTVAPGATSAIISIPIRNDAVVEEDETFRVTLQGSVGAALGTNTSALVTIRNDDDGQPQLLDRLHLPTVDGNSP